MTTVERDGRHTSPAVEVGHTCWSYADPRPFDDHARAFLHAGLTAGERVWYVAGNRFDATADWLRGLGAETRRPDTVRVVSVTDAYHGNQAIDPLGQRDAWAAEMQNALAAGFPGMRVVADVTDLVRTDAQREAFARYEYHAGRLMRSNPLRGLCAFDRNALGERVVAELACLHQVSHEAEVPFRLYPGLTTASVVLDGEVDQSTEDLFTEALRHIDPEPVGGEVIIDACGLRFIDHRSMFSLQRFAESRQVTAVIRTRHSFTAHLADLLSLPHVRVEHAR